MRPRIQFLAAAAALLTLSVQAQPPKKFTDELWTQNLDVYQEILKHPFLKGLTDGSLKRDAFAFYMMQDAHYLREFAKALSVTASKSPREDWAALLSTHAADSFKSERKLHESVFREYGITAAQVSAHVPAPEASAYMSFMVANAYSQSFEESLAALLPCYWIYLEVGRELRKAGSRNPVYQKWIENYSSEDYQTAVDAVLDIVNEAAQTASPDRLSRMRENFRKAARYEWMFWDSAYAQRQWLPSTPRR